MGLFNSFVNQAKNKLNDFQNSKEQINHKRFKDPNAKYNQPQQTSDNYQNNNQKFKNKKKNNNQFIDPFSDDFYDGNNFNFNDDPVSLYPAQRPESFHFFILENQYQDLERAIRGVKDVWDKENQKWVIKRKKEHCFTDEESEEIVRTAQSHLSSDIKLAILNTQEYPILLDLIYNQLWVLFKSIMDYRFGRFGNQTKQLEMKQQAVNIFTMLTMRIKANYSRAIGGRENSATHDSVKGQESLNQTDRKDFSRGYT
jgi:hypothetical protein